jgi:ATP-dependent RNA helicase SUPV3L1/SUV3
MDAPCALRTERSRRRIRMRVPARLHNRDDAAITLSEHGRLWWDGASWRNSFPDRAHCSRALLLADEHLPPNCASACRQRLDTWLTNRIATRLEPLLALRTAADAKPGTARALPAEARGTAHQLCEALGSLDRTRATLPPDLRVAMRALRSFGVKFARRASSCRNCCGPMRRRLLACCGACARSSKDSAAAQLPASRRSRSTMPPPDGFLAAAGFHVVGPRAIRLDMLDRLEQELEAGCRNRPGRRRGVPKLVSLLGCDRATLDERSGRAGLEPRRGDRRRDATASVWRQSIPRRAKHRRRGPRETLPTPRAIRPTRPSQVWLPSSRRIDAMSERIRIDKWLWHARFYKSRALAQHAALRPDPAQRRARRKGRAWMSVRATS